jgi:hypothetical protein
MGVFAVFGCRFYLNTLMYIELLQTRQRHRGLLNQMIPITISRNFKSFRYLISLYLFALSNKHRYSKSKRASSHDNHDFISHCILRLRIHAIISYPSKPISFHLAAELSVVVADALVCKTSMSVRTLAAPDHLTYSDRFGCGQNGGLQQRCGTCTPSRYCLGGCS